MRTTPTPDGGTQEREVPVLLSLAGSLSYLQASATVFMHEFLTVLGGARGTGGTVPEKALPTAKRDEIGSAAAR